MKKKVLLVRFSAMGDVVLTTGPIKRLRQKFPGHRIDLLTSDVGEELLGNNTNLDKVFVVPKGCGLIELRRIYKTLENYDLVIDWQNNFKSHFLKLYVNAHTLRINKQAKKRRLFVKKRKYKEDLQRHVAEKYYDVLIEAFGLEPMDLELLRPWLFPNAITFNKNSFDISKAVALHPYASQKNKHWPGFTDLGEKLLANGVPVVVVGSTDEPLTWPEDPNLLDLTNRTTIREMISVLSKTKVLVSTDSGPMHLGIAVNTPTLALFGPTTREFGFYPRFDRTKVLEITDLQCRPCHIHGGHVCPLGTHECMKNIKVDEVLNLLKEVSV